MTYPDFNGRTALSRRRFISTTAVAAGATLLSAGGAVRAQADGNLVIAFPTDVHSWDPIAHLHSVGMPVYRSVFDAPLTQTPDMELIPHVVTEWAWSEDGMALELAFRDDVAFHNDDRLTAEDFRFSYWDRPQHDPTLALAGVFQNKLVGVEVASPVHAIMRFSSPMPTAPQWLAFLGNFILPKDYFEFVGHDAFLENPVGSGPYRLADYQRGSQISLEAFENYWGGRPENDHVVFRILPDASARTAAIQSGQADIAVNIPTREAQRLNAMPGLIGEIGLSDRVFIIHMMNKGVFQDRNVRLAAHAAIDKEAISAAFMAGQGASVNVPGARNMPGYPEDLEFPYSPDRAREWLAESGYDLSNPARLTLFSTNGAAQNDWDIARAVQAMWAEVGIEADLQPVDAARFFELNAAGELPEGTVWSWANGTNDPELYLGNLLDPDGRFSVWRSDDLRPLLQPLLAEPDYEKRIAGYRDLGRYVIEEGYVIPIIQAVNGLVAREGLEFSWFQTGWFEPHRVRRI